MGLIHIYCGDGKGKTTAAVGLAVRCAGAGGNVLFFQFLKDNTSGERFAMSDIKGIELISGIEQIKFFKAMNDTEKQEAVAFYNTKFEEIEQLIHHKNYDLVVLDEVIAAVNNQVISEKRLLDFIINKPQHTELVLTGRKPSEKLCEFADYISEIKKIKHPFDKGIRARKMIEY